MASMASNIFLKVAQVAEELLRKWLSGTQVLNWLMKFSIVLESLLPPPDSLNFKPVLLQLSREDCMFHFSWRDFQKGCSTTTLFRLATFATASSSRTSSSLAKDFPGNSSRTLRTISRSATSSSSWALRSLSSLSPASSTGSQSHF